MWLIVLAAVLLFLVYFLGVKPYRHWEQLGVPYVKPVPFFGNIASNVFHKKAFLHLLEDFYYAFPDKRFVGFYQFLSPTLVIRDPDLIKTIAVKEFDVFPEHRTFATEDVDPLWAKNLAAIRGGERWHDMRSTLSPSFTSSKMRMMFGLMKKCSEQLVTYLEKQGSRGGTVTLEMKDTLTRFTNDVIGTTAFGIECNSLENPENEFYLMGKDASDFSGIRSLRFFLNAISPTLMKVLNIGIISKSSSKFFSELISETLRIRRKKGVVRPDMIQLLMEAQKGRLKDDDDCNPVADSGFAVVQESENTKPSKKEKIKITDEDITAQALIFFLAGFDSSADLMCFATYELAINPDVQQKLLEEIDQTLKDCRGSFTYDALMKMKYLDMVASETLRKWPPSIMTDRVCVRPFTIEPKLPGETPITLEEDTTVWFPIYPLHRDSQYYPNPKKFDPERFNEENKKNIKPFTYMPFGAGPRSCIASRFALLESKLVLAEILSKFEIVPVAETQIPLQLHKGSFQAIPENGFWLGLKPRSFV